MLSDGAVVLGSSPACGFSRASSSSVPGPAEARPSWGSPAAAGGAGGSWLLPALPPGTSCSASASSIPSEPNAGPPSPAVLWPRCLGASSLGGDDGPRGQQCTSSTPTPPVSPCSGPGARGDGVGQPLPGSPRGWGSLRCSGGHGAAPWCRWWPLLVWGGKVPGPPAVRSPSGPAAAGTDPQDSAGAGWGWQVFSFTFSCKINSGVKTRQLVAWLVCFARLVAEKACSQSLGRAGMASHPAPLLSTCKPVTRLGPGLGLGLRL